VPDVLAAAADRWQDDCGSVALSKEGSLWVLRGALWELATGDRVADPERGI